MGKIVKKYIGSNQVGASQILLENNSALRSRNFADSADVNLMSLDPSDLLQMLKHPYLPGDATANLQAASKQQVLLRDGTQAMSAALDMGTFAIQNLAAPTNSSDAATKGYVDSGLGNKANTNLDNLAAGDTSIPAGVDLRSLETDQSTGFRIFTANQASSVSGALQIRTGTTTAGFVSGAISILPGLNSSANGTDPFQAVTGGALIRSGSITGGTQGSTGVIQVISGGITVAGVTGHTGLVEILSGNNTGVGTTGSVSVRSGESSNASGGSSGTVFVGSGKALNAASGDVAIYTGDVSNFTTNYAGQINNAASTFATGNIQIVTGSILNNSSSAKTGDVYVASGSHSGSGSTGQSFLTTGNNTGTGNSGNISLVTGSVVSGSRGGINLDSSFVNINSSLYFNGNGFASVMTSDAASSQGIAFKSGDAYTGNSGLVAVGTGDALSGTAGDLALFAGLGSSVRGNVNVEAYKLSLLNGTFIDMNGSKITELQNPTNAQDAATKAYVDAQVSAGVSNAKESVTLSSTDISNQYVDLANKYLANSTWVGVGARVNLYEGLDFTVSVVGGVTRMSFIGPSASLGAEALAAGDILYIQGILA